MFESAASTETSTLSNNLTNFSTSRTATNFTLPFTDAWVVASTCILAILFVFGVIANSITIAVIHISPRLKSHYFSILLSICVSDTTSAFVSILFLYRRTWGFEYFEWTDFFCRLYWGLDLWTSFSTALHILSFAILRLIGIHWPFKFQRISSRHMKLWIGGLWIITFFGGFVPHFIFNTANDIDRANDVERAHFASCSLSPDWISVWQVYVQFAYTIFLFIPALSIIGISITIAILLKHRSVPSQNCQSTCAGAVPKQHCRTPVVLSSRSNLPMNQKIKLKSENEHCSQANPNGVSDLHKTAVQRRQKKDKQAIYQLVLIVGSFLLGYIPLTAFHFYTGFNLGKGDKEMHEFDWRFAMIQYFLLRFSECLNPVFYNMASKRKSLQSVDYLFEDGFGIEYGKLSQNTTKMMEDGIKRWLHQIKT